MQIQKKMALAYFRWTEKQYQSPQQNLFFTGTGLPDRIDSADFKSLIKQLGLSSSASILFDELVKREESFLENNIHLLFPEDETYPTNLKVEADGAPILCVQGALPLINPFLTVVGSRVPSLDSLRWMRLELAFALKKNNISLISGAARGIDQEAHELALTNDVPTLAFLPCGIDYIYPDSFLKYKELIIEQGGAVISGFAPWAKMRKSFFHQRNKWMVAISDLVLVIEANRGGGSWMTGKLALENGRQTAIVPVHPLSSWGLGNNDLLHDGKAHVLRDGQDILSLLSATSKKISDNEK